MLFMQLQLQASTMHLFSHKIGATVKDIGQAAGADVAIDFNFADTDNGIPIGRVIADGNTVISDSPKTKARDELYMLPVGSWHIGKAPANVVHAVQGSPRILKDSKSFTAESVKRDQLADSSWKGKNYRVTGSVTAEGRLVSARTLDKVAMDTLEGVMLTLGCPNAVNGDGGGTPTYAT
jgi:exopolysaccharide biosynthesis protein